MNDEKMIRAGYEQMLAEEADAAINAEEAGFNAATLKASQLSPLLGDRKHRRKLAAQARKHARW